MKKLMSLALIALALFACNKNSQLPLPDGDSGNNQPYPDPLELPEGVVDIAQANSLAAGLYNRETANCYVINEAGAYAFPADVRGNGVSTKGLATTNTGIVSAGIVWDKGNILRNVSLIKGTSGREYVVVETPQDYQLGNALVAVKDASGNILWSWHIWSTRYRVGVDDQVLGEGPVTSYGCWAHMPLELGMTTENDPNCMLYQWGRKDPFPTETPRKITSTQMSLEESFRKPDTYCYYTNNRYSYCTGGDVSLWNPGNDPSTTVKTMLDPCPPGYFVMPYYAASEALLHGVSSVTEATIVTLRSGLRIWYHPIIWNGEINSKYHFYWQHSYWQADDVVPTGQKGSADVQRAGSSITVDNTGGIGGGFPVRAVRPAKFKAGFMGDSITQIWGGSHENNGNENQRGDSPFFISNGFLNKGISGQTTSQMLKRFDADIVAKCPPKVVILAGTNDLAGNDNSGVPRSSDHIMGNLSSMAQKALNGGADEVFLCSVLPTSKYGWRPTVEPMPLIRELNAKIKAYCESTPNVTYVDYYSAWLNDEGTGAKTGLTYDEVHPTVAGCALLESIIFPYLK